MLDAQRRLPCGCPVTFVATVGSQPAAAQVERKSPRSPGPGGVPRPPPPQELRRLPTTTWDLGAQKARAASLRVRTPPRSKGESQIVMMGMRS